MEWLVEMNNQSSVKQKQSGSVTFRVLWRIVRVLIAIGLIAVLILRTDIARSLELIQESRPMFLVLAAALFMALILVGNLRWKLLLQAKGYQYKWGFLLKTYLAAVALNSVLPTALGGDVLRMLHTSRPGRPAEAVSIVLVDRALGLVGLLALSLSTSLVLFIRGGSHELLLFNILLLLVLILVLVAIFLSPAYRLLVKILNSIRVLNLGEKLIRVIEGVRSFKNARGVLGWAFCYSLLLWMINCSIWYSLGIAVGTGTSLGYYLLYVPIVAIVAMVPLSIGGVGIRENGFAILMARAGMPGTQAATIALLFLLLTYLYALLGVVMLVWLRREGPVTLVNGTSKPDTL